MVPLVGVEVPLFYLLLGVEGLVVLEVPLFLGVDFLQK
jgi:hypothetical protein